VDLDPGTCDIVARYAATVRTPVGEGFVFSDDDGATAWKPNRVTKAFGTRPAMNMPVPEYRSAT